VGGDGNDALRFTSDEIRTNLKLSLGGGAGNDDVRARFGAVESAQASIFCDLGDGDDVGLIELLGVLRGSANFLFRMDGGAGDDRMQFYNDNGSHAGASLTVNMDGGAGKDWISVLFDDNMVGAYRFTMNGGADKDTIETILRARSGSTGSLQAFVRGDAGDDNLTLRVEDQSSGQLHVLRAVLDRHVGHDTWSVTPNVTVV
jgi:hypothetical protein